MDAPPYARLHYRTAFSIDVLDGTVSEDDLWTTAAKKVRGWVARRIENSGFMMNDAFFGGAWFIRGGEWAPPAGRGTLVKTLALVGDGDDQAPEHWTLRFVHRCDQTPHRWWQTDVSIHRSSETQIDFGVLNYHWIGSEYVGPEPMHPIPTSPALVKWMMTIDGCQPSHGNVVIGMNPRIYELSDITAFQSRLVRRERDCPVVYISLDRESESPLIDPQGLARSLAGNAVVCVPATLEADMQFKNLMPHELRADEGMVRVFRQIVDPFGPRESSRHRFILSSQIKRLGEAHVRELLANALARRYSHTTSIVAKDIAELTSLSAHSTLEAKLASAPADTDKEWMSEIEEEINKTVEENKRIRRDLQGAEGERDQLKDELDAERFLRDDADRRARGVSSMETRGQSAAEAIARYGLPVGNLGEAITEIEAVLGENMVFLDEAKRSAKSAGFNSEKSDMAAAVRMLYHLGTTWHSLIFRKGQSSGALDQAFRNATGIDITLTERKQTKKDASLSESRKFNYDGETIDCTPHLKLGSNPKTALRIHFGRFEKDGRQAVVVGHCGDHMTTSGTRRRK